MGEGAIRGRGAMEWGSIGACDSLSGRGGNKGGGGLLRSGVQ